MPSLLTFICSQKVNTDEMLVNPGNQKRLPVVTFDNFAYP